MAKNVVGRAAVNGFFLASRAQTTLYPLALLIFAVTAVRIPSAPRSTVYCAPQATSLRYCACVLLLVVALWVLRLPVSSDARRVLKPKQAPTVEGLLSRFSCSFFGFWSRSRRAFLPTHGCEKTLA